jgi:glycosyltransferase involved in cell wall biosynthesis
MTSSNNYQTAGNRPIISFCIPTYNRSSKIYSLVTEILRYNGSDIEVVVIDNHSIDDTKATLSLIKDDRFHFYENIQNIGAVKSGLRGMTKCCGFYVFNCCDKDYIDHRYIFELVAFLQTNLDVALGHCSLNSSENTFPIIFNQGIDALQNVAYLSKHATGIFFNNDALINLNIGNKYSDAKQNGGFILEYITAELCLEGKAAIINLPLCSTESKEEAKCSTSLTYNGSDGSAYFFPEKRYELFEEYVIHILSLHISELNKNLMVKKVFHRELVNATVGFKNICQDLDICSHYNLAPEYIGYIKLFSLDWAFCKKFIKREIFKTRLYRLRICFLVHLEIVVNVLRMVIVRLLSKIKA